jgi:hypothetical protein
MIKENVKRILKEIPPGVKLVAATKKRTPDQIKEAIEAGIEIVGENYVKEAQSKFRIIGKRVKWHLIGHLQKNKVKKAIKIFDMIQTLDSFELAYLINKECEKINKVMPVLIEINIAKESQKSGVYPNQVEELTEKIIDFKNIKIEGLMTMGPLVEEPQRIRPFFKKTKEIFDKIKKSYQDKLDFKYLSMGMSDTYKIAIEEGANIVRVGRAIFGPRG